MAARLAKIDAAQRDRDLICDELSAIALTDNLFQQIERAAAAVERVEGQLALVSATVEFVAATDIELVVGDQRVSLPAGQSWSTTAGGATEVEVPGVLTARFTPGTTALDIQAEYAAAQQNLAAALAAAQVADVAAARQYRSAAPRTAERPRPVDRDPGRHCAVTTRSSSCAPGWPSCVPSTHAGDIAMDATAARAELEEADAARVKASADLETHRKVAAAAAAKLAEISTQGNPFKRQTGYPTCRAGRASLTG